MTNAIIAIDYDEFEGTYRAVHVRTDGSVDRKFDSGHPEIDWRDACEYAFKNYPIVLFSSTCDNFVIDNKGWKFVTKVDWPYPKLLKVVA